MRLNKFIAILCATLMLFSFTSCGNKQNEENKSSSEVTGSYAEIIPKEESEHKENSFTEEETIPTLTPTPTKEVITENMNNSLDNIKPDVDTDLVASSGLEFESNGDGTCSIIGLGICTDTDIVIPIVSPDGDIVTLIEEYAFMSLEDVTRITFVNYNYEVDECAFQYGKFEELNIIGGNPVFKESAFSSCENLKSITFTDCNIEAEEYAFFTCGKDAVVSFTNCNGTLGERAFQYGSIATLEFLNCELELHESVFSSCEDLTLLKFTDSTVTVDDYAFYTCGNDATVEFINCNGILGERVFQYSSIETLKFSNCELELYESAFSSCEDLIVLQFANSTITAKDYAFYTCGDKAIVEFINCSINLDDNVFQYSSVLSLSISGDTIEIGESAFSSCEDLTSVIIDGNSVTLGEDAFYSCEDLVNVKICDNENKENIISIDDSTFQYCENLENVVIGNGTIELGEYVFSGCADNLILYIAGKIYTADGVKKVYK